jgi:putative transposase
LQKAFRAIFIPVLQVQGVIAVEKQGQYLTPFQRKLLQKSIQTDLRPEYRRRIEIMLLADIG